MNDSAARFAPLALAFAMPVAADTSTSPALPDAGWQASVGVAMLATPLYSGSDEYGLSLVPDLRLRYGERFFASIPEGVGYQAWRTERLIAGPLVKLRFSRKEDSGGSSFRVAGKTNDLRGLGDVDTALEWGGFAEYGLASWAARAELRRGAGGHEGWVADLSLNHRNRAGSTRYTVGPRMTLASEDFMQTYYGVNASQAGTSGLPRFNASGGLVSAGVGASTITPLQGNWRLGLFAGYDRLLGDAADSPLVRQRGTPDQFSFVTSLSYTFR